MGETAHVSFYFAFTSLLNKKLINKLKWKIKCLEMLHHTRKCGVSQKKDAFGVNLLRMPSIETLIFFDASSSTSSKFRHADEFAQGAATLP